MIQHELILPFTQEWWVYNLITIFIIIGIVFFGQLLSSQNQKKLTLIIASLFIFEFVFMDAYHLYTGSWSMESSLPLHLCSLMWVLSIYFLLTQKQWAFEMMLFVGMPGGIHSLLTPELTHGGELIHRIDFFIGHGGLVLVPFYAIFVLNMWPTKHAWLKSFLKLQILVILVGLVNWWLGSNYMYLAHPPIANNPLIPSEESFFGSWPYYIIIFELAVFIHAFVINLPFYYKGKN